MLGAENERRPGWGETVLPGSWSPPYLGRAQWRLGSASKLPEVNGGSTGQEGRCSKAPSLCAWPWGLAGEKMCTGWDRLALCLMLSLGAAEAKGETGRMQLAQRVKVRRSGQGR